MKKVIAIDFDGTLFENKWPEIGMPMVIRILLNVQEVQEVQEKTIVREAMLKMSATECMKLLYKNEPLGKRIVAAAKIIFGR